MATRRRPSATQVLPRFPPRSLETFPITSPPRCLLDTPCFTLIAMSPTALWPLHSPLGPPSSSPRRLQVPRISGSCILRIRPTRQSLPRPSSHLRQPRSSPACPHRVAPCTLGRSPTVPLQARRRGLPSRSLLAPTALYPCLVRSQCLASQSPAQLQWLLAVRLSRSRVADCALRRAPAARIATATLP